MASTVDSRDPIRVGRLEQAARRYTDALVPLMHARPKTRDAAAALLTGDESTSVENRDQSDAAIDALIHAGFLAESDGSLEFIAPERVIGELAMASLEQERQRLGDVMELISEMPELTRAWQLGSGPAGQEILSEITQGGDRAMLRWFEIASRMMPGTPSAVLPDMAWIHDYVIPMLDNLAEALAPGDYGIRYLVDHSAVENERDRHALDQMVGIGITIRLAPRLPSWFYVDQKVMTALPTSWGADSPVGMAIIYSSPVVHAMHTLFESLWATGVPYPRNSDGWQSVLELLAEGKSDDQVAKALNIARRTVQRRIADAMEEFGVESRFELGAAWAAGKS